PQTAWPAHLANRLRQGAWDATNRVVWGKRWPMSQRVSVQRQRIGPAIRKLRRTNGLTLDDLASQAGISASHLSRLERGQTLPSFTVLAQIAHVLGTSVDEFVQLEQDVTALDLEFGGSLEQFG